MEGSSAKPHWRRPKQRDEAVAGTGSMAVPVAGWWRRVRAVREVLPLLWEMDPVLGDGPCPGRCLQSDGGVIAVALGGAPSLMGETQPLV